MSAPLWLREAYRHVGVREMPGPAHEPAILAWWKTIRRGGIRDDETPWCAAFVGACLESAGVVSTRFESARSYLQWGDVLSSPLLGSIVVLGRTGGGHVGFVVGLTAAGDPLVLGGNQDDQVSVRRFASSRVLGYRWPSGVSRLGVPRAGLVDGQVVGSTRES